MNHRAAAHRICAVSLLVLAGSPLTAPFSTCDVTDLFGGHEWLAGSSIQCKTAPDDSLPTIDGASRLCAPRPVTASAVLALIDRPAPRDTVPVPLRL
jgi:hypothetical protein